MLNDDEKVEVITDGATLQDLTPLQSEIDVLLVDAREVDRSDLESALRSDITPGILFLVGEELVPVQDLDGLALRSWGFVSLDSSTDELLAAIGALNEGMLVGSPDLMKALMFSQPETERQFADSLPESLSGRENEVLQLLAQGLANKQIALALNISEHTVKFHISAIYGKLGATSRTEAVRLGIQTGLIVI
jgi:DNA-binding NarL/FixJ family response regulator